MKFDLVDTVTCYFMLLSLILIGKWKCSMNLFFKFANLPMWCKGYIFLCIIHAFVIFTKTIMRHPLFKVFGIKSINILIIDYVSSLWVQILISLIHHQRIFNISFVVLCCLNNVEFHTKVLTSFYYLHYVRLCYYSYT